MTSEREKSESPSLLDLRGLPEGWTYLNKKYIDENFSKRIDKKLNQNSTLENFFNGRMQTSFDIALTSSVPRRFYIKELIEKINYAAQQKELRVTLLTGPGGEGKSTILQQLAIDLINQTDPSFHILFRDFGSQANLPIKYLEKLLDSKDEVKAPHNFIIVSDNSHEIARDVFHCIESGIENRKHKIQFLLASRGTHWRWQEAHRSNWKRLANEDYEVKVTELTKDDAEKIVIAWDESKDQNNKSAHNVLKERAAILFNAARDEKISGKNSNSFYRAIFQLRKNKTLESYISDILDEFEKRQVLDGRLTLKDFYAYIVVLHADGFPILNIPVLCQVLGCEERKLREAIELLADERDELFSESNKYILTRHDVFAEEARRILSEQNYPTYFDKILSELVVGARQYYKDNEISGNEIRKWNRLPETYFYDLDKDNEENRPIRKRQAVAMAGALGRRFYSEPVLITQWAKFLRVDKNFADAATILSDYFQKLKNPDKAYFVEWAVVLGLLGKNFLSVWLAAIALSDEVTEAQGMSKAAQASLEERQIGHLCSLCTALSKCFAKCNNSNYEANQTKIFKSAAEAALRLISDKKVKENIRADFNFDESKIYERIRIKVVPQLSLEKSFEAIEAGIDLAYQLRNSDNEKLSELLPKPPLNLSEVKRVFGIGAEIVLPFPTSHTFPTKPLIRKPDSVVTSQSTQQSIEKDENSKFVFQKLDKKWKIFFIEKELILSEAKELRGLFYIKLALSNPYTSVEVYETYKQLNPNTKARSEYSIRKSVEDRVSEALSKVLFKEYKKLGLYLQETIKVQNIHPKAVITYTPSDFKANDNLKTYFSDSEFEVLQSISWHTR